MRFSNVNCCQQPKPLIDSRRRVSAHGRLATTRLFVPFPSSRVIWERSLVKRDCPAGVRKLLSQSGPMDVTPNLVQFCADTSQNSDIRIRMFPQCQEVVVKGSRFRPKSCGLLVLCCPCFDGKGSTKL